MQRIIIATLAVAAAFLSTMAHGQLVGSVNLDATGRAEVFSLSVETLSNASDQTVTVDGETYYSMRDAEILTRKQIGVRGASGRTVYVRYDLENMVFFPVQSFPFFISPFREFALEAGGSSGSSWYIGSTSLTFSQTQELRFSMRLAIRPTGPGTVTYTAYLDLSDAIHRRNPVYTKTRAVFFPVRSLQDNVTPGVATATVTSGFTRLAAAGANTLGTLAIAVGDDRDGYRHYARTVDSALFPLAVNDFTDVAKPGDVAAGTGSLATFRGDFSVGTFYANTAAAASCGTAPLTTKGPNDKVLEKATVAAAEGVTALCVAVPATNTAEIPEGEYTVEVDYEGLTNAAFPPLDLAETSIGRIRRDGTRVQIPYLTIFSGYRQNVVIVNRNTKPVAYTFKFTAEDGVAATPGEMAEGVVPAQDRAVLKATDIVSLEGKTRTAATLDVVAASGTVDVATVQVNMNDKGTDTVLLESLAN